MGRKNSLRSQIYGHGAGHLPDRRQGRAAQNLAQGEGRRPCGGRAGRGGGPVTPKTQKTHRRFGPRLAAKSFFWHRNVAGSEQPGSADNNEAKASMLERIWAWLH